MKILEEIALHYREAAINSDKIWAACYTDTGEYVAIWGRRGTKYQQDKKVYGRMGSAEAHYRTKEYEKLRKGYQRVSFNDARYGNIPTFSGLAVAVQTAPKQAFRPINAVTLVEDMQECQRQLEESTYADMANLLMRCQQLYVLTETFSELPIATPKEVEALLFTMNSLKNASMLALAA